MLEICEICCLIIGVLIDFLIADDLTILGDQYNILPIIPVYIVIWR